MLIIYGSAKFFYLKKNEGLSLEVGYFDFLKSASCYYIKKDPDGLSRSLMFGFYNEIIRLRSSLR